MYFALKKPEDLVAVLIAKKNKFFDYFEASGYFERLRRSYAMYYNMDYDGADSGHQINFSGEQGELAVLSVNHYKNIGTYMLNLITSSRPTMEARAINTDYKSRTQTKLANGLLDYYMREKRLELKLRDACELAIFMAAGYIRHEWNATRGERVVEIEGELPIYEGDIDFSLLNQFQVVFDRTKENFEDSDWLMVITYKNKYDLAAKYPEYKSDIESLATKRDLDPSLMVSFSSDETDDVPVYEFYHKKTEALPDGRYVLFLDKEITLLDSYLPYDNIPVTRIVPSTIHGTPFGYTPMFDLMPLQEAVNLIYSSILTNQQAFAIQNIYVPRNAGISFEAISGGLNIIEGDAKPEPINLTQTPKEIFEFLNMLIAEMERISGINSVVRGSPEANLRSGNAMALLQSNSIQFMTGLAMQYNQLIEDVGTSLIKTLQQYAATKRVAAIVGESNRSYLREFNGDDISNISRVVVSAGNPISKTTAGRIQIADGLLQYGLLKNPNQYFEIVEGQSLSVITEAPLKHENLIVSENEKMLNNEYPIVLDTDKHMEHINEHLTLLDDVRMRENPELVKLVLTHVSEHKKALEATDPFLLMIRGQQSLQQMMPPAQPQGQAPAPQGGGASLPTVPSPLDEQPGLPNTPTPPGEFENAPVTPQDLQASIAR